MFLPVVSTNEVIKSLGQMLEFPEAAGHRVQISVELPVTSQEQSVRAEKRSKRLDKKQY